MSQMAALEALNNGEADCEEMVEEYNRRRKLIVSGLNAIGLECNMPGGAFYAFPSIRSTGLTSDEFTEKLLFEEKVAVVPGNAFGECGEGHVRCSYATGVDQIREGIDRMARFVERIRSNNGRTAALRE
jgi:aminotransferase